MPKRDPAHMSAQRERIILATITCIARKGIERTSISDICKEVGLSAGALYVHFRNKDDLVAECLVHGSDNDEAAPGNWTAFKARVFAFGANFGLDAETVIRARLYFHAEAAQAGPFHDLFKKRAEVALETLAQWLQMIADKGDITLRMDAQQTAAAISAQLDGMLWLAVARDRPLEPALVEISDSLDLLVGPPLRA